MAIRESAEAAAERRMGGQNPPVSEWRVHIGAHKTATTHLQDTLEAIRPVLLRRGVDAIDHRAFRKADRGFVSLRNWRIWAGGRILAAAFRGRIEPLRAGPDRLILSEENFLGSLHNAVQRKPYRSVWFQLRVLAAIGAEAPLHLFLTIRRMDAFLPSAYAQLLRNRPAKMPFGELKPALVVAPPRWTDVVRRVRRAVPNARLTVWRYEDYRAHRREIVENLCGTEVDELPDIPPPKVTMRPSAAAVRAAEALDRAMPRKDWRRRVEALYSDAAAAGGPSYAPFDEAECERFAAAYAADCADLTSQGFLMRFPRGVSESVS